MNRVRWGLVACSLFFGLGLTGPTFTIHPSMPAELDELRHHWLIGPLLERVGRHVPVVDRFLSGELEKDQTFTIMGAILKLFSSGNAFLGCLLFLFSVIFPVGKLALYWVVAGCGPEVGRASGLLKWTHRVGKFSMAEVFVLALLVVDVQALPGGSTASLEWAAYVFIASVIATIVISFYLDKVSEVAGVQGESSA